MTTNDGRPYPLLLSLSAVVDYGLELYSSLGNTDEPEEMSVRRDTVLNRLDDLEEDTAALRDLIEKKPDEVARMREEGTFTAEYLEDMFGISQDSVYALRDLAKEVYDCGNYVEAAVYLQHFIELAEKDMSYGELMSAMWGQLAAEILSQNFEVAVKSIEQMADRIDNTRESGANPMMQLQSRAWLMHWSMFVFLGPVEDGKDKLIDFFFREKFRNAIVTYCPWLLRYLAAAAVTNKRRWRSVMPDIISLLKLERYEYSDPITEFVLTLCMDFDFEGAQEKLDECAAVLDFDYFLRPLKAEFLENGKFYTFETYCRIHSQIDIKVLGEKLGLSTEDAEKWIISLIRETKLDAKINSEENILVMGKKSLSIHQKIVSNTRNLTEATYILADGVRSLWEEKQRDKRQQQEQKEAELRRQKATEEARRQLEAEKAARVSQAPKNAWGVAS